MTVGLTNIGTMMNNFTSGFCSDAERKNNV